MCTAPAGDKYSHAKKWKIPCVTSSWVLDSIEAGYCLPTDNYRVEKNTKSSTPTKQDQSQVRLDEVSMPRRYDGDEVCGTPSTPQPCSVR